jgi:hypothetical protein
VSVNRLRLAEFPYVAMTDLQMALSIMQPTIENLKKEHAWASRRYDENVSLLGALPAHRVCEMLDKVHEAIIGLECECCENVGCVQVGDEFYCEAHATELAKRPAGCVR